MPEIGQVLSHYRLIEKIGEGGMGVVWSAEDTVLRRSVALKFLPDGFDRDPERLTRFEREARFLASLNHSNIAAIHGLEESDGQRFLIMELAPGEPLADRLRKGRLGVEESLKLAGEIARALEAAHEKGVIHRDLKPGNVQVTPKGQVKVLDFGLAKAFSAVSSASELAAQPTMTAATGQNVVMGTTSYMSPEQASGQQLDKRTDIWAFGCVLYEMLTGERAFLGDTVSSTLTAIHGQDPSWERLPAETPVPIVKLLQRCLEKDATRRLHDIADARIEIEDVLAGREWAVPPTTDAGDRGSRRRAGIIASALVVGIVLGAAGLWMTWRPSTGGAGPVGATAGVRHFSVETSGVRPTIPQISPNGRTLVYGSSKLFVHHLDRPEGRQVDMIVPTTTRCLSPDGRWLAVAGRSKGETRARLFKLSLEDDRPPQVLADWPSDMYVGMVWLPGGEIVGLTRPDPQSGNEQTIVRFPATGGASERSVTIGSLDTRRWLWSALPQGILLAMKVHNDESGTLRFGVDAVDPDTGAITTLVDEGGFPVWSPTGHLLYTRRDELLAAELDARRLEILRPGVVVADGLSTNTQVFPGIFDVSRDGTLVFRPGGVAGGGGARTLVTVDREGRVEPWSEQPQALQGHVVVSGDGQRLAALAVNTARGSYGVWVANFEDRRFRLLDEEPGMTCAQPVFSPDGIRVFYTCFREQDATVSGRSTGLYARRFDGTDEPELVAAGDALPTSFSPDGSVLLLRSGLLAATQDIFMLEMQPDAGGNRQMTPLLRDIKGYPLPLFSPDGRWIAYSSGESGTGEAHIREFRADGSLGPRIQVSRARGGWPDWHPGDADGEYELSFVDADGYRVLVTITTRPEVRIANPRRVAGWERGVSGELVINMGDPLPDGRYMAVRRAQEESVQRLVVVQNWFSELERKLAATQ